MKKNSPIPAICLAASQILAFGLLESTPVEANGNVSVTRTANGSLYIKGDTSSNGIEIEVVAYGRFRVRGVDHGSVNGSDGPTKINGVSNGTFSFGFAEINHDVIIVMDRGDDSVRIEGEPGDSLITYIDIGNALTVDLGEGSDSLNVSYLIAQSIKVTDGAGSDYYYLHDVEVIDNFVLTNNSSGAGAVNRFRMDDGNHSHPVEEFWCGC